jgi:hypothetical protein
MPILLRLSRDAKPALGGEPMTRAIPFTAASLARAIKGVEQAGRFVIGVKPDGTLIVGDKPIDSSSLVPTVEEQSPVPERRFGEKLGGQGET